MEAEARYTAVATVLVRGDTGLDRAACSGDGENKTDLGYVSAVAWAVHGR